MREKERERERGRSDQRRRWREWLVERSARSERRVRWVESRWALKSIVKSC